MNETTIQVKAKIRAEIENFPTERNMALDKFEDLILRESTEMMLEKIKIVTFMGMIIAMKGDAYTGKTTCANAIAKAYSCSVVSFDSILDSLSRSAPSPQEADRLADLAFDVVVRVIRLQLCANRPVVVDSPLSKQSHLERLLAVADEFQSCENDSCDQLHCRSVIVECKPGSKYTWEQRFVNRDSKAADKWYKPKEWKDVVHNQSVEYYPPERLPENVCRLIVDTTGLVPANYHNLGPATLDLVMCPKGHLLHFRDWLPHKPYHTGFNPVYFISKISGRAPHQKSGYAPDAEPPVAIVNCGDDGCHRLEEVATIDVDGDPIGCCRACHGPISHPAEPAYACTRCKLALHNKCAELEKKAMIPHPHSKLPLFLRILSSPDEFYSSIPEEYKKRFKCSSCKEFSVDCEFCLWEMHLGAREVPTMVRHEGHHGGGHPICFWITSSVNPRVYLCEACKLPGYCVGYTCLLGTFKFNYHVECALLPRPVMHDHGGHKHDMKIVFGTEELKEDYICDVCLDPILDPKSWYYFCQECVFVSHLHCIYKTD